MFLFPLCFLSVTLYIPFCLFSVVLFLPLPSSEVVKMMINEELARFWKEVGRKDENK